MDLSRDSATPVRDDLGFIESHIKVAKRPQKLKFNMEESCCSESDDDGSGSSDEEE
jgi:hypothetical protein